ncbi:GNAT family N-acetyltransferase [Pseudohalocynthiibacter aestuariivivens]|nr:GNAT family N-acetyltransferase [Pseudohalocynthiibacter aestuariivivens]QIE44707.1 GNAT family N-acetyltransferase [Pseudohalocynthiibacter aestuariivivens]
MPTLTKRRYHTRISTTRADITAAQKLRALTFGTGDVDGSDRDRFDDICSHILIEDSRSGDLVCCFRMLPLGGGAEIGRSYSAQFYELSALERFDGPMVEMGRFCVHPEWCDPDILRAAWGAMTRYVDDHGVEMLFGCSSFHGTDADSYLDAFAMLKERHLAPRRWLPRVKAPLVFRFAQKLRFRKPDAKQAMLRMPPLLRTYLMMGGWVSDHAVVDPEMGTLHVFTGVEIRAIPATRKRLLRAVAQ